MFSAVRREKVHPDAVSPLEAPAERADLARPRRALNDGVGTPPQLYEQGREDTELVKRDGKWLISRRYISSDSGLPDRCDATWEPRDNPFED